MRGFLLALLVLASPAAAADDWQLYSNTSHGFQFEMPPGYEGRLDTTVDEGQLFEAQTADITVSAGIIAARDFEAQAAVEMQADTDAGWGIWFQRSTPQSASYGGKKGDRQMFTTLIPVCGGRAFATVTITFGSIDAVPMQRPVSRIERTLRDNGACSAI